VNDHLDKQEVRVVGDEYVWPFRLRPALDHEGRHLVLVFYHGGRRPAHVTKHHVSRTAAMREARMFILYTIVFPPLN
jgi:hypothetical protein